MRRCLVFWGLTIVGGASGRYDDHERVLRAIPVSLWSFASERPHIRSCIITPCVFRAEIWQVHASILRVFPRKSCFAKELAPGTVASHFCPPRASLDKLRRQKGFTSPRSPTFQKLETAPDT